MKREEVLRLISLATEESYLAAQQKDEEEEEATVDYYYGSSSSSSVPPPPDDDVNRCAVCHSPTTTRCAQCKSVRYWFVIYLSIFLYFVLFLHLIVKDSLLYVCLID